MIDWQPIETAPQDGTDVLFYYPPGHLFSDEFYSVGRWDDEKHRQRPRPYWHCQADNVGVREMRQISPTHWAPLGFRGK